MLKRLFGMGGVVQEGAKDVDVDVVAARAMQQHGAQLIDVREPDEFAAGHARGARNIPLGQLAGRTGEIKADATVLLICHSGNRSTVAIAVRLPRASSSVRPSPIHATWPAGRRPGRQPACR